ncbi:hypothetical protein LRD18_10515 [Halorhodospira halochloris]|uniref:hypothetical protein n=1 Tax=Halorhodospira halochloris TaxID=1052 RepID=UPI001EE9828E|nr:hypothetical protein [Halorhodospira halochloris]MCG5531288.1 hypothetical protein [Halorhodospira halochloris]
MDRRTTYFVLRDRHRDRFYTAAAIGDELQELIPVEDERRLALYAANHGIPMPDPIPDWVVRFEPDADYSVDWANQRLNTFQSTPLLRNALRAEPQSEIPPLTQRLLTSLTRDDEQVQEHLLDWLAALIQRRTRIGTAWLLHGLPGTGKRLLTDYMLRPLLGTQHVVRCTVSDLAAANPPVAEFEHALLVVVDPFEPHKTTRADRLMQHMHALIDDPVLTRCGSTPSVGNEQVNHANVILCGDYPEPLSLKPDDRRFHIAPASDIIMQLTEEELEFLIDPVVGELPVFAAHLAHRRYDPQRVARVIKNKSRQQAINLSSEPDACFAALKAGNLQYFEDLLARNRELMDNRDRHRLERLCKQWAADSAAGRPSRIYIEGLQRLAEIAAGGFVPRSDFNIAAKRYAISPKPMWNSEERKTMRGVKVRFQTAKTGAADISSAPVTPANLQEVS